MENDVKKEKEDLAETHQPIKNVKTEQSEQVEDKTYRLKENKMEDELKDVNEKTALKEDEEKHEVSEVTPLERLRRSYCNEIVLPEEPPTVGGFIKSFITCRW